MWPQQPWENDEKRPAKPPYSAGRPVIERGHVKIRTVWCTHRSGARLFAAQRLRLLGLFVKRKLDCRDRREQRNWRQQQRRHISLRRSQRSGRIGRGRRERQRRREFRRDSCRRGRRHWRCFEFGRKRQRRSDRSRGHGQRWQCHNGRRRKRRRQRIGWCERNRRIWRGRLRNRRLGSRWRGREDGHLRRNDWPRRNIRSGRYQRRHRWIHRHNDLRGSRAIP